MKSNSEKCYNSITDVLFNPLRYNGLQTIPKKNRDKNRKNGNRGLFPNPTMTDNLFPDEKFLPLERLFLGDAQRVRCPNLSESASKIENGCRNRRLPLLLLIFAFCILSSGCQTFARKFVRKPKAEEKKEEELVLIPEEYQVDNLSNEQLYCQYYLYWKSWQDELIDSLSSPGQNRKKQLDCLKEAVRNLTNLKGLLEPQKQKLLDNYINEMNILWEDIIKDRYENFIVNNFKKAERLKRDIQQDFSFVKIKDYLL